MDTKIDVFGMIRFVEKNFKDADVTWHSTDHIVRALENAAFTNIPEIGRKIGGLKRSNKLVYSEEFGWETTMSRYDRHESKTLGFKYAVVKMRWTRKLFRMFAPNPFARHA